jgi:hypothetical protein
VNCHAIDHPFVGPFGRFRPSQPQTYVSRPRANCQIRSRRGFHLGQVFLQSQTRRSSLVAAHANICPPRSDWRNCSNKAVALLLSSFRISLECHFPPTFAFRADRLAQCPRIPWSRGVCQVCDECMPTTMGFPDVRGSKIKIVCLIFENCVNNGPA